MADDVTDVPPTAATRATNEDEVLEAGLAALAQAMWRQRARLDQLALRAKVAQLVLAGDDHRWVDRAVRELEDAARTVRAEDQEPARLLRAIVRHLGLPPGTTIRELSEVLSEPWSRTLMEHAVGLHRVTAELTTVSQENRQMALGGLANIRALVAMTTGDGSGAGTYDRRGRATDDDRSHVDRMA